MRIAVCLLLALLAAGCAETGHNRLTESGAPAEVSLGLPGLAAIAQARSAHTTKDEVCAGSACTWSSQNAVAEDTRLILSASPQERCWGIWTWNASGHELLGLSFDFDLGPSQQTWIAIADYASGNWEIRGPLAADAQYVLNDLRHKSGAGLVCCAAITWDGATATVRTVTLTVDDNNLPPVAALDTSALGGKAPLSVDFSAALSTDSDGTIVDYEWDLDGNAVLNEAGPEAQARGSAVSSFSYSLPGSYQTQVRVTDDGGLSSTASAGISVQPPNAPPSADLQASPQAGAAPLLVSFDAGSSSDADGSLLGFAWDFDGDLIYSEPGAELDQLNSSTAAYTYSSPGLYSASVLVTDDDLAQDSAVAEISAEAALAWAHTWGGASRDAAVDIACAADGSYFVLSDTDSFGGGPRDLMLLKFSAGGNLLWQKTWGGDNYEAPVGIELGASGDLFIACNTRDANDIDWAAFLRFDADGNLLWQRRWGVPDDSSGMDGRNFGLDAAENLYSAGYAWRPGGQRPFELKLDSSGNVVWQESYDLVGGEATKTLAVEPDGTFYVGGLVNTATRGQDYYLAKLDAGGSLLWELLLGTNNTDYGLYATVCAAGGVLLAGSTPGAVGGMDGVLIKVDTDGNLGPAIRWGGIPADKDHCAFADILEGPLGAVYVAGTANRVGSVPGPTLLCKFDAAFQLLSQKGWGFPTFVQTGGSAVALGPDGIPIVCGSAPYVGNGAWSDLAGVSSALSLSVEVPDSAVNAITGTISDAEGAMTSPVGVLDLGGGDVDMLVVKEPE